MVFWLFFLLAALVNFLTLAMAARARKVPLKRVLDNPAFVFGDFILIPAYFALLANFLQSNLSLLGGLLTWEALFLGIVAAGIVLFWGRKFGLVKLIWLPHGLIALFLLFTLMYLTLLAFIGFVSLSLVVLMWAIFLFHQGLGMLFPKKL